VLHDHEGLLDAALPQALRVLGSARTHLPAGDRHAVRAEERWVRHLDHQPHFDLNELPGPTLKIRVRAGETCAASTVTLRRNKKSGAAVFP
jgi:hypothetical protein